MKLNILSSIAIALCLASCGSSGSSSSSSSSSTSDSDSAVNEQTTNTDIVANNPDSIDNDLEVEYLEMVGDEPLGFCEEEISDEELEELLLYYENLDNHDIEQQYNNSARRNYSHKENMVPPFIDKIRISSDHNIEADSGKGSRFYIKFRANNLAHRKVTVKLKLHSSGGHGIYTGATFARDVYEKTFTCDSKECNLAAEFIIPYWSITKDKNDPMWSTDIDVYFTFLDENGNEISKDNSAETLFYYR